MPLNAVDDFALFGLGVWGDGETWARGGMSDFGSWRMGRSGVGGLGMSGISDSGGWIHERDGGVTELCVSRDDFDGVAENGGGFGGGRHVVVVERCCCR